MGEAYKQTISGQKATMSSPQPSHARKTEKPKKSRHMIQQSSEYGSSMMGDFTDHGDKSRYNTPSESRDLS